MTKPFDPFNQCTEYAKQIQELLAANAALELEVARLRSVMANVIKAHGYEGGTPTEVMSTSFTPTALEAMSAKVSEMMRQRAISAGSAINPIYGAGAAIDAIRALPNVMLDELL